MANQPKKPEKPAENDAAGSVYRIKDVTESAWSKGALPLPGLDRGGSPTLTPLDKADEDAAVELAMTGEIPLALILEALAKQEANRPAEKPKKAPSKPRFEPLFPTEPIQPMQPAQPVQPVQPVAPAHDSYATVMIRPEEIVAPTPEHRETPPPPTTVAKPQQPKKKPPAKAAQSAKKANPQQVKAAKDEMEAMAKRAKPEPQKPPVPQKPSAKPPVPAQKPAMEAAEELAPPPVKPPAKPQQARPQQAKQQAKKPAQQQSKPQQAKQQSKPQPKTEKKPEPQPKQKPVVPVVIAPQPQPQQKSAPAAPKPKRKLPAIAFQPPASPQGDEPLYTIPYKAVALALSRDIYYFGLRSARPLLMFRRRVIPVLAQPLLTLWHILRAMAMALHQITLGRAIEAVRAARAAHKENLRGKGRQSFTRGLRCFVRDYALILRTAGNILLPIMGAAVLLLTVSSANGKTLALKVTYNGQEIYVKDEATYLAAKESAESHINIEQGEGFAAQAMYEIVETSKANLLDEDTARDAIWQHYPQEMANACGVYVDDALVAVVRNESDASGTLESIKREHAGKMQLDEGDSIGFVENIQLVQSIYPVHSARTMDAEGLYKLLTGAKEGEVYEIARDTDSLYSIAKRYDTTQRRLEHLNPQFAAYLHGGDKVVIAQEVSFLQLTVTKTEISMEEVRYETVDTNNSKLYRGEVRTTTKGVKGEERVTRRVTYINGVPIEGGTEEIARERTKEPVTERREIGTKSTRVYTSKSTYYDINPSAQGFVWPAPALGQITSSYGYRGRSFHSGMDISGSGASGKLVVAAKDGVVESIQRSSSGLGNAITINHGNGVKTRYGHLYSGSISVSQGERVTAGQPIARVGSTGNSTGPHLHFEVIINGSTQNPRNYVSR